LHILHLEGEYEGRGKGKAMPTLSHSVQPKQGTCIAFIHISTHPNSHTHLYSIAMTLTRKSWPETLADTKFIYKHKMQHLSNAGCLAVIAVSGAA